MSNLGKIVLVFLFCGVAAGLAFAALTTPRGWQGCWFFVSEWWIVPTWRYWLLAEALFVLAISSAYLWARSKSWLFPWTRSKLSFWAVVLWTSGVAVILLCVFQLPALALLIYFLLMPAALVTILYMFSGRWDGLVAILIVLTNVFVTLMASIPDLLLTSSLSIPMFQSLKAVLGSAALAGLTGLWLARGTTDSPTPDHASAKSSQYLGGKFSE
jgi:hypothetical protein